MSTSSRGWFIRPFLEEVAERVLSRRRKGRSLDVPEARRILIDIARRKHQLPSFKLDKEDDQLITVFFDENAQFEREVQDAPGPRWATRGKARVAGLAARAGQSPRSATEPKAEVPS